MSLRPYQKQALQDISDNWRCGISRQLLVMATGLGKTHVAAHIPEVVDLRKTGKRLLFLVHMDQLAFQACEKFKELNPGLKVGMEKAQYRAEDADIVVASVQTLGRGLNGGYGERLLRLRPDDFSAVCCDESHHGIAKQYLSIFRYMRVLKGEKDLDDSKLFLGITATPNRSDAHGLERLFDKIVFNYPVRNGVDDGWLSRIVCTQVQTEVDLSQVRTEMGDFCVPDLSKTVNTVERNELIARECLKHRQGPAFFFCVDIQHAIDLAEVLRGNSVRVYPISGKTPEAECRRFMRMVNEGAIDGLSSAGKLNEGVDAPRVMTAHMARPTKSPLLFTQMVGRVLRKFPSPESLAELRRDGREPEWEKPYSEVIDYVDVCGRHANALVATPSLFGLRATFDAKGKDLLKAVEEIEALEAEHPGLDLRSAPNLDAIKTSLHRLDLLKAPETPPELRKISKFVWLKEQENSFHLGLMDGALLSVRVNTLGQWDVYRHMKGIRTKLWVAQDLKEAVQKAEEEIPARDAKVMSAEAGWRREGPTEKQAARLIMRDHKLRQEFGNAEKLYAFLCDRFEHGDLSASRGGVSARISSLEEARR